MQVLSERGSRVLHISHSLGHHHVYIVTDAISCNVVLVIQVYTILGCRDVARV
jgi:hypothetical protein